MSASGAGGKRIRRLFDRAAAADSLAGIILQGIGAVFFAAGSALASGIFTVADVIIVPLSTLTGAVGDLINAIFGGSATIIQFGALGTATSIGPGGMFNVGPLTFALGIGAVLLALLLVNAYISRPETGNFAVGLPFDVPTPFFQGPEEDNEEE
ncbi:hypothetical protein [Haloarcula marina]|uniref:hypothetical protein n=1 Tax=Haloarcula marina TaxID=2961574 RepID=UPI0020B7ECF7|nr:hypothetical protein [Halomicroarcula marina]